MDSYRRDVLPVRYLYEVGANVSRSKGDLYDCTCIRPASRRALRNHPFYLVADRRTLPRTKTREGEGGRMIYGATDEGLRNMRRWLNEKLIESDTAINFHDRKLIEERIERERTQARLDEVEAEIERRKG